MYVIKRNSQRGGYLTPKLTYSRFLEKARIFSTFDTAAQIRQPTTETVMPVSDILVITD